MYALEGFLCRLAASEHAGRFALKGGVLMAAYDARRPTRDIDLHARALSSDETAVLQVIRDIVSQPFDDGLVIDTNAVRTEVIRDESDGLPDDFAAVLDVVVHFADPILSGRATDLIWQPERQTWS